MSSRRSDYRTEQAGLRLTHHVAPAVVVALEHLSRERSIVDGWTSKGDSMGRGSSDNSTTEAAMLLAVHLDHEIDDIRDLVWNVEFAVKCLADKVIAGIGVRVPAAIDQVRCKDGQVGRRARFWSDDEACADLPDKKGMCTRHYWKYRRYCQEQGLDTSRDFEAG